jgi:hypothetical protein
VRIGARNRLLYVPAEVVDDVARRVEAMGRIDAPPAEISAINLGLFGRGELDINGAQALVHQEYTNASLLLQGV